MKTLRQLLLDWVDPDVAAYYLGVTLGLWPYDDKFNTFSKYKWVFWTHNPLGNALGQALVAMEGTVLETNMEQQYRWRDPVKEIMDPWKPHHQPPDERPVPRP